MKKNIAVLAGDGVGPEVMSAAIRVLKTIEDKFDHQFEIIEGAIGGDAFEKYGEHFPEVTKEICFNVDAILFGSVGGPVTESHLPKWKSCETNSILALRKCLALSTNIRPIKVYSELADISPLKPSRIKSGIDILIFRELLGDSYFGDHLQGVENHVRFASDVAKYDEQQIATIAHHAFGIARERNKKITSVDKANVLDTSKLWRQIMTEVSADYPDVQLSHMLVDNCAMQLILNPTQFDIIVTSNLFGDILSDAAAALAGSLGLIPSGSLNKNGFGLYEPAGGSAPDIAGKNIANPIAQILSLAMLLRYSFHLKDEADAIEHAITTTLASGKATQDICVEGANPVSTYEMTEAIVNQIKGGDL